MGAGRAPTDVLTGFLDQDGGAPSQLVGVAIDKEVHCSLLMMSETPCGV
jgi:hypothetical protein